MCNKQLDFVLLFEMLFLVECNLIYFGFEFGMFDLNFGVYVSIMYDSFKVGLIMFYCPCVLTRLEFELYRRYKTMLI